jgi:nitrile hydratase accessory protein
MTPEPPAAAARATGRDAPATPRVARPVVDPALAAMPGRAAPPRRNGELVFEAPWQGRAFGLALGVVRALGLPWRELQERLIAEIDAAPERPYYESWVAALERLVVERGAVTRDEIERRAARTS